jgi:hypothetical protein
MSEERPVELPVADVTADTTIQPRVTLDEVTTKKYLAILDDGRDLDPILVYRCPDGVYRVCDGFHRLAAYKAAGRRVIPCVVREGSTAEAFDTGFRANARHGKCYSVADKNRSARLYLHFFPDWSDAKLAEAVGVTRGFVLAVRKAVGEEAKPKEKPSRGRKAKRRAGRDGKTYRTRAISEAASRPTAPAVPARVVAAPPPPPPPPPPAPAEVEEEESGDEPATVAVSPAACQGLLAGAIHHLRAIRTALSRVMATPFAEAARRVAGAKPSWALNQTGQLVVEGARGNVPFGVAEFSTEALDEVGGLLAALKLAFSRLEDEDVPAGAPAGIDPADFGRELAGDDAHDF